MTHIANLLAKFLEDASPAVRTSATWAYNQTDADLPPEARVDQAVGLLREVDIESDEEAEVYDTAADLLILFADSLQPHA